MTQDLKCPKCQDEMIQGFIYAPGNQQLLGSWVEGQPKRSWWGGAKVTFGEGTPIGVFRCEGCGYLEFYAGERFAAQ